MRLLSLLLFAAALQAAAQQVPKVREFVPGAVWNDTTGKPIQAHGGGILKHAGVYYWYGEDKTLGNGNKTGVGVYSSRDLYSWKHEGIALKKDSMPEEFRDNGICERPKVLYNAKTKKFVMWMHLDDAKYRIASAGIAVSDTPTGPFRFLRYFRPVPETRFYEKGDDAQQDVRGGTYRDMNLFLDNDGAAYAFYSSEGNWTMYVVKLSDDFTDVAKPQVEGKTWSRIFVKRMREAPAPFRYGNRYYIITSGCTGWAPNAATYGVADSVFGPYVEHDNPMRGPDADKTFGAQSTFVLPAPSGKPGAYIFLADRWNPQHLEDSRYVWLPFTIDANGAFTVDYREKWVLSVFDAK